MTIQANSSGYFWTPMPPSNLAGVPTFNSEAITAVGHKIALICEAPKTGTIRNITFGTGAVGGTTGTFGVDCTLESVDQTSLPAVPSGTLVAAGATVSTTIDPATDDNVIHTTAALTTPYAVTKGDLIAIVLEVTSVPTGTPSLAIAKFQEQDSDRSWPKSTYSLINTASWAESTNGQTWALNVEYNDGTYAHIPSVYMGTDADPSTATCSTTSDPSRHGIRFRLPYPANLGAAWFYADLDGEATLDLYDDAGTLITSLMTLDENRRATNSPAIHIVTFAEQSLAKDTWYRLVLSPTTTTSLDMYYIPLGADKYMGCYELGANSHRVHVTLSSWETTETSNVVLMGLGLSGFDDGVGSGGGILGAGQLNGGFSI